MQFFREAFFGLEINFMMKRKSVTSAQHISASVYFNPMEI